jgi:hypothetical protein
LLEAPRRAADDGPPALRWWTLAVALAGVAVLEPDHIARILAISADEPDNAPTVDEVRLLGASAEFLGAESYSRVCSEALDDELVARLLRCLRTLLTVRDFVPRPLPMRLDALEHACLSVAALNPRPIEERPAQPVAVRAVPPAAVPTLPDERPSWAYPRRAPAPPRWAARQRPRLDVAARLDFPRDMEVFDGLVIGDLTLSLARTPNELRQWGRLLHNCLADFVQPATFGASVVVGVRQHERLIGAFEVSPVDRSLVQFVGDRNRPLPETVTTPVRRELVRAGVRA